MELVINANPIDMVEVEAQVVSSDNNFIEANTIQVELDHLKNDCIIPVFSKDNESTISHYEFINETYKAARELFCDEVISQPNIRVSHIVKGRVPSAVGKPAKDLLDFEKTIYYERCAFIIEVSSIRNEINGNFLNLTIGGVRSYNQENLYSKKSLEKFKLFIGFKNQVCTNLCVNTDGFSDAIRVGSLDELRSSAQELMQSYNFEGHLSQLSALNGVVLLEGQFAHLIGKLRMYTHLDKNQKQNIFPVSLNDNQINNVIRDYYNCPNFKSDADGTISLWKLYNLFTEANKSSYIDSNIDRNVTAHELVQNIYFSVHNGNPNWLLS